MKGPEYYIGKLFGKEPSETEVKRKRTDSKGNTIIDSTIDGKPVSRRRIEGIGSVTKAQRQYESPIGPKNKPSSTPNQTFGQAFAAARKAGKKEFMYNGKPYHTRTKEEEAAKSKLAAEPKPKAKKTMRVGKPGYNRRTIEKAMGGSMCEKTTKKAIGGGMSSKPKGVGCATHGYGKAMK